MRKQLQSFFKLQKDFVVLQTCISTASKTNCEEINKPEVFRNFHFILLIKKFFILNISQRTPSSARMKKKVQANTRKKWNNNFYAQVAWHWRYNIQYKRRQNKWHVEALERTLPFEEVFLESRLLILSTIWFLLLFFCFVQQTNREICNYTILWLS